MSYYEYPIKCMACSLHYLVLSDQEDWYAVRKANGGYCPECGTKGGKMLNAPRTMEGFIFQSVPGEQRMTEITAVVQDGVGLGAPTVRRMEEGA